jgi:hypothetical protein
MHEVDVRLALTIVLLVATGGVESATVLQQAATVEKEARTPAQRKLNSQLLHEIYRLRGEAEEKGVPPQPTSVRIDAQRRALVDVRAEPTSALQRSIRSLGGVIISVSPPHRSIVARIPLLKLETLAEHDAVSFIEPAAEPRTVRPPGRNR